MGTPTTRWVRVGVLATGTEVLDGRVEERNVAFIRARLHRLGLVLTHVVVVGDRRDDIESALKYLAGTVELVVVTGGLGPTADDLTAEVVAAVGGLPLRRDEALERLVMDIARRDLARAADDAMAASARKQALVPGGAIVLNPVGTAPGFVLPRRGDERPTIVALPGPPDEVAEMWPAAMETAAMREVIGWAGAWSMRTIRMLGDETDLAETLRGLATAGVPMDQLEVTTCFSGPELEIATRHRPEHGAAYVAMEAGIVSAHGSAVFSLDGATIDEVVARLLVERGLTIAVAESLTGGGVAARLTAPPGSSDYVVGGFVTYAGDTKTRIVGVSAAEIEEHGVVSLEVAAALADRAAVGMRTDIGVGITGVAGPAGGTPEVPVGTVCLSVVMRGGHRLDRTLRLPGDRAAVRRRTATAVLHLVRELLQG